MLEIFIQDGKTPDNSVVSGLLNPVPANLPTLVCSDTIPLNLFVVDGAGNYSDVAQGGYTAKIALGLPGQSPVFLQTGTAITNGWRFDLDTARASIVSLFATNPGLPVTLNFELKIYDALNNVQTFCSMPANILPPVFTSSSTTGGDSMNITGNTLPLVTGGGVTVAANIVTVAGLTWNAAPSQVFVVVNLPAGAASIIFANVITSTITKTGFQFVLSAIPDNNNYTFTYMPVP